MCCSCECSKNLSKQQQTRWSICLIAELESLSELCTLLPLAYNKNWHKIKYCKKKQQKTENNGWKQSPQQNVSGYY